MPRRCAPAPHARISEKAGLAIRASYCACPISYILYDQNEVCCVCEICQRLFVVVRLDWTAGFIAREGANLVAVYESSAYSIYAL